MKPIVITTSVIGIEQDSVTLLIEIDIHGKQWDSKEVTLRRDDWFGVALNRETMDKIVIGEVQP